MDQHKTIVEIEKPKTYVVPIMLFIVGALLSVPIFFVYLLGLFSLIPVEVGTSDTGILSTIIDLGFTYPFVVIVAAALILTIVFAIWKLRFSRFVVPLLIGIIAGSIVLQLIAVFNGGGSGAFIS